MLPKKVAIIGSSAGAPVVLAQIVPRFPEYFPGALIVVQHMRPGFTKLVAKVLAERSDLIVREADDLSPVCRGAVLVAPGAALCTVVRQDGRAACPFVVRLGDPVAADGKTPGPIDAAMISAARTFGSKAIGVLLTGIGSDGREGMKCIKENGGATIVQDEATSVITDAPRMIAEAGLADDVLPLWSIPDRIMELVGD